MERNKKKNLRSTTRTAKRKYSSQKQYKYFEKREFLFILISVKNELETMPDCIFEDLMYQNSILEDRGFLKNDFLEPKTSFSKSEHIQKSSKAIKRVFLLPRFLPFLEKEIRYFAVFECQLLEHLKNLIFQG